MKVSIYNLETQTVTFIENVVSINIFFNETILINTNDTVHKFNMESCKIVDIDY